MIDFKDKNVLITGGTRGIGAACVKLFYQANANVAFTFRTQKEIAKKISNECFGKGKNIYRQVDVSSEQEINDAVGHFIKELGTIDILVNNAGIWEYGAADSMTLENWERTIRINLTSMFIFTKAVLPQMVKNNYGKIINVSSTAGQRGEAFHSHYAASKGGMISYTKSLAAEFGKYNININCVAPGWVDTDMCTEVFSDLEYKEKVRKDIPIGRIATAEDIAGPILFLASDLARHINGEILNVNGGSILCG
ncbi:MAG: SDR family oxidoreductase [Ignavibacteriales bacterium]|nr:SDR family oxidoreductase [Ignavibacteriales bacterium]